MLTAVYAARNIVGEKHDVWTVNTEAEYHEEQRIAKPLVPLQSTATNGDRQTPRTLTADELIEAAFADLDPIALGSAVGIVSGVTLFLATVILLLKGGAVVGPTLALLGNYLLGFDVTWRGSLVGLVEAGGGGFILGYVFATLRNLGMSAYAWLLKHRAERVLLEKI